MKAHGFSTAEFLLYLCIMTMIMGFTTASLVYDYARSRAALVSLHEVCMLSTASDGWVHDVHQASDLKVHWYQPDAHTMIMRCGNNDVGWCLQQKKLVRVAGVYDVHKQQWLKKTVSLMATGVTDCTFTCIPDTHNNQRIHAVRCTMVSAKNAVTRNSTLRNGIMV